ncbi:MAG: hypothetical protein HC913_12855 [Microscillaceae bacterium]|nr:hypothetical protein [Microscillaceae bacterium]
MEYIAHKNRPSLAHSGSKPFFQAKSTNPFMPASGREGHNPFLAQAKAISNPFAGPLLQRKCTACEQEENQNALQKKEMPLQRACSGGSWQYEYDGCSVPQSLANIAGIDKDNPAGGTDTHFGLGIPTASGGRACDRHDECYQTCNTPGGRAACDRQMYADMMATCHASSAPPPVKKRCQEWALRYYRGLQVFGGSAYRERQQQSCNC